MLFVHILQILFPSINEKLILNNLAYVEIYRFVTSIFLHSSMEHLLQNVIGLMIFGLILEGVVGWKNFLKIFLLSGIIGNIAMLIYDPNINGLGSSGGVMGIIGALAYLRPWMPVYFFAPLPVISLAIIYFIIDLIGLIHPTENIGYAAHIGGFITGVIWAHLNREKYKDIKTLEEDSEDIDDEEAYSIIKNINFRIEKYLNKYYNILL